MVQMWPGPLRWHPCLRECQVQTPDRERDGAAPREDVNISKNLRPALPNGCFRWEQLKSHLER